MLKNVIKTKYIKLVNDQCTQQRNGSIEFWSYLFSRFQKVDILRISRFKYSNFTTYEKVWVLYSENITYVEQKIIRICWYDILGFQKFIDPNWFTT